MLKLIGRIKKFFYKGKKVASETEVLLNSLEYKDGDYYIAHCLEFDIVAQGRSIEEARERLAELIKEQIIFAAEKDIEEKVIFHPAPEKYWEILHHLKTRLARKVLLKDPRRITTDKILGQLESTNASFAR